MSNVIPLKKQVRVGKVYARGETSDQGESQWAFNLEINGEATGFAFGNRTDAVKGRVLMRKKLQDDGYKILS
jgi:hypothetical protein